MPNANKLLTMAEVTEGFMKIFNKAAEGLDEDQRAELLDMISAYFFYSGGPTKQEPTPCPK